jgi:hypothetical protein
MPKPSASAWQLNVNNEGKLEVSDLYNRAEALALIQGIAGWLSPSIQYRIGRDGSFIPFTKIDGENMLRHADLVNFATARRRMIQARREERRNSNPARLPVSA